MVKDLLTGARQIARIYAIVGMIAFAAFGYAMAHLGLTLFGTPKQTSTIAPTETLGEAPVETVQGLPAEWPAIFGTYDPQPPGLTKEVRVRQANTRYTLKGLFTGSKNKWAIIEDGAGEYLIREGDEMPNGEIAAEIDESGIVINVDGERLKISFDDG